MKIDFKRKLAVLAIAGAGLGWAVSATAVPFNFATSAEVSSMDPYAVNGSFTLSILGNIYEPLVGRDQNLKMVPGLATSWSNTAPTVWRFNLRKNVVFHDGTPFTADDVVFSLARARSDGSGLKNVVASVKEIKKIDDHTVDFITHAPTLILPDSLTHWFIMSKVWSEKNGATESVDLKQKKENAATLQANGTGPFMLKSRRPDVATEFAPNLKWWDKPAHNLTEVKMIPIENSATRVAALISGEVDMVSPVPLQDVPRVKSDKNLSYLERSSLMTISLVMDQIHDELPLSNIKGKNPLKDARVRQAIFRAIDINAIQKKIMRGSSTPSNLTIAPMIHGYPADLAKRPPYDLALGKKLMAEAGYPNGFEMALACPTGHYINDEAICQAVSAMLAKIDIKLNVLSEPKTMWMSRFVTGKFSMSIFGDYPDSQDAYQSLYSTYATRLKSGQGSFNVTVLDPKLDELTTKIGVEMNEKIRNNLIHDAFKIAVDEMLYIPLHQQAVSWGMKKNVQMTQTADGAINLKWVVVK